MLEGSFFNNSDVFWYYNKLILRRQLQGHDLLVCCLDTGSNYDTFSIALLHDYYESKQGEPGHVELGSCRIMSMIDNLTPEINNYKGHFKDSSGINATGVLAKHIEESKIKINSGKFSFRTRVVNKITFNHHGIMPYEKYNGRLDAIVVSSMTTGYKTLLKKHASFLLRSKGVIFVCEMNEDIDIQGMKHIRPGVYIHE